VFCLGILLKCKLK